MSDNTVITRFAPSPTGILHIGGARTALFNYYFARHHGGKIRLRIEDTDHARSTETAKQAILDGLDWLQIPHDGPVIYQSENQHRHVEAANQLLDMGAAYKCYLSPEEQGAERQLARDQGRAFRSPYRDNTLPAPAGRSFVIRFRVPDGKTVVQDQVLGEISWDNKDFDDLVLLRADGTPVYMLAVVVDDHDMGVTHVIRGDDHLTNAGRQQLIYQALGWPVPAFAHVPLIFGPDGKKLSKRHGALGVMAYADMGYIPSGMRNYLTRLGWGHGDMEVFDDAEIIKVFSLSDINKAPARLDFDKLDYINGQHMQTLDAENLWTMTEPFLTRDNEGPLNDAQSGRVRPALGELVNRAKTLVELIEQVQFLTIERPLTLTGKAKKSLKGDALDYLADLYPRLAEIDDIHWTRYELSNNLNAYCEEKSIGFGKIGAPLRACLTAGFPSPDLTLVLELMGKGEALGRISDCLPASSVG